MGESVKRVGCEGLARRAVRVLARDANSGGAAARCEQRMSAGQGCCMRQTRCTVCQQACGMLEAL
tara:strand:+ start:762 stop:956 length:195 start_codon:yes stop_codon:yes gene_type:complete